LHKARQKYKRVRRSVRAQRNEKEFRAAHAELKDLREQLSQGFCKFEVWYFDEAGFALTPTLPYAWQPIGEPIELESVGNQGKRQNVLGFLRWDGQDFYAAAFEGWINNHIVAGCFRHFAQAKKAGSQS
jgi:hypothetical protein